MPFALSCARASRVPSAAPLVRLLQVLVLTVLASSAIAERTAAQVQTPPPGSPLRAEVLDALRPMVAAELGAPIEFVVSELRVVGEWAFVIVRPQRPGGGPIRYAYTRYQRAWDADAMSDLAIALLRRTPVGWLVYAYEFGPTDVAWLGWVDLYPTPREVFPF